MQGILRSFHHYYFPAVAVFAYFLLLVLKVDTPLSIQRPLYRRTYFKGLLLKS